MWLITSAVVDVLISIGLTVTLRQRVGLVKEVDSLLRRLMFVALRTASYTAIPAVAGGASSYSHVSWTLEFDGFPSSRSGCINRVSRRHVSILAPALCFLECASQSFSAPPSNADRGLPPDSAVAVRVRDFDLYDDRNAQNDRLSPRGVARVPRRARPSLQLEPTRRRRRHGLVVRSCEKPEDETVFDQEQVRAPARRDCAVGRPLGGSEEEIESFGGERSSDFSRGRCPRRSFISPDDERTGRRTKTK